MDDPFSYLAFDINPRPYSTGGKPDGGADGKGPKKTDECRKCGKTGHWARDCRGGGRPAPGGGGGGGGREKKGGGGGGEKRERTAEQTAEFEAKKKLRAERFGAAGESVTLLAGAYTRPLFSSTLALCMG
jgi:hypothetical protein